MQVAIFLHPGLTTPDAIGPHGILRSIQDVEPRFAAHETGPVLTDSGVLVPAQPPRQGPGGRTPLVDARLPRQRRLQ